LYRRAVGAAVGTPTARLDWAVIAAAAVTLGIVDGAATALLLAGLCAVVHGATQGMLGVLRARALTALGGISYALYLVHENIGWTVIHLAEARGLPATSAIAVALAVSGALAWLVMRCVEQPALTWIRARHTRAVVPAAGNSLSNDGGGLQRDPLRQQVDVEAVDEAVVGLDGER